MSSAVRSRRVHRVAGDGRPADGEHHRLLLGVPGVVDARGPTRRSRPACSAARCAGQFHAETAADEDQESGTFLAVTHCGRASPGGWTPHLISTAGRCAGVVGA